MQSLPVPIVTDNLTSAQVQIRDKLHKMRKLFEDEDDRVTFGVGGLNRPESSEWDLHNHRLIYEETLLKR